MKNIKLLLLTFSVFLISDIWPSPTEPTVSEEKPTAILFWSSEQKEKGFKRIDEIIPSRPIKKGKYIYHLETKLIDLSSVTYDLYGKSYSIKDYIFFPNISFFTIYRSKTTNYFYRISHCVRI